MIHLYFIIKLDYILNVADNPEYFPNRLVFDGVLNNELQYCSGPSGTQSALLPIFIKSIIVFMKATTTIVTYKTNMYNHIK